MIRPVEILDRLLTDEMIVRDVSRIIWRDEDPKLGSGEIGFQSGNVFVPWGTTIFVVAKAFFYELYDWDFGTSYKAQVSIGDIILTDHHVYGTQYCFATLDYGLDLQLITVDFHKEMR